MGLVETTRRFILKRCQYSSLEKFEDAFDTALYLISGRFSNLDKCQPEAACDVISGKALDYVGMNVPASLVISPL